MNVIVEDLMEFTPKKVTITINEPYELDILTEFLRDNLRRDLCGDLEDLCRQILKGLV